MADQDLVSMPIPVLPTKEEVQNELFPTPVVNIAGATSEQDQPIDIAELHTRHQEILNPGHVRLEVTPDVIKAVQDYFNAQKWGIDNFRANLVESIFYSIPDVFEAAQGDAFVHSRSVEVISHIEDGTVYAGIINHGAEDFGDDLPFFWTGETRNIFVELSPENEVLSLSEERKFWGALSENRQVKEFDIDAEGKITIQQKRDPIEGPVGDILHVPIQVIVPPEGLDEFFVRKEFAQSVAERNIQGLDQTIIEFPQGEIEILRIEEIVQAGFERGETDVTLEPNGLLSFMGGKLKIDISRVNNIFTGRSGLSTDRDPAVLPHDIRTLVESYVEKLRQQDNDRHQESYLVSDKPRNVVS